MSKLKNLSVEGTVILVTGGTSGIGRVVTATLCAQGASVVFTGRNETEGNAINTELRDEGSDCHFVSADLREEGGITRVIDTCLSTYGRLDVAFNNAGIFDNSVLFHEYKDEDWETTYKVNLKAPYELSRKVAKHMKNRLIIKVKINWQNANC